MMATVQRDVAIPIRGHDVVPGLKNIPFFEDFQIKEKHFLSVPIPSQGDIF